MTGGALPGRTLFVRAGALGDFVLTLPVLDRLIAGAARARATGRAARVEAAVPERFIPLLPGGIDRVWRLDRAEAAWIYAPEPVEPRFTHPRGDFGALAGSAETATEATVGQPEQNKGFKRDETPERAIFVEHITVKQSSSAHPSDDRSSGTGEPSTNAGSYGGYDRIVCFSAIVADSWAEAGMDSRAIWARRGLPDRWASGFYLDALPAEMRELEPTQPTQIPSPVGNTDDPSDLVIYRSTGVVLADVAHADTPVVSTDTPADVASTDIPVASTDTPVASTDIPPSAPTYVISPGSGGQAKRWPIERWQEVEARLSEAGARCVWCVGPVEEGESWRGRINPHTGRAMEIVSPDLAGMIALSRGCAGWLGPDSGPLHLAAAAGCPVLALFLVTDPAIWCPPGALAIDARPPSPSPTPADLARLALTGLCRRRAGRWG